MTRRCLSYSTEKPENDIEEVARRLCNHVADAIEKYLGSHERIRGDHHIFATVLIIC